MKSGNISFRQMKISSAKTEERKDIEALLFRCLMRGDPVCDPEVREFAQAEGKTSVDEETRLWPKDDELRKLDEVCKRCPKALFAIEKKECPACGSKEIDSLLIIIAERDFSKTESSVFPYKCAACGKSLFSYTEL